MPRRDLLTYDVEVRRRRSVPWGSVLLLAVVVAVAVLLVGWMVASRTASSGSEPVASAPPAPASSATPSAPPVSLSPLPSGSDADEGLQAPEGSQAVASKFVAAWLDRNPTSRKAALATVASPALAEQLMLTDPANIPAATVKGAPVLDDASTYSVQFTQALSAGPSIRVYLVADPQARYRWVATSVERA